MKLFVVGVFLQHMMAAFSEPFFDYQNCFLPLQPNRVVNHVHSPLMAACYAHSLECMKLLVEVLLLLAPLKYSEFYYVFSA
jgi:hypothetical protein